MDKEQEAQVNTIIKQIWEHERRVTYAVVEKELLKNQPKVEIVFLAQPTFSRMLQRFLVQNGIIKLKNTQLRQILDDMIQKEVEAGITDKTQLKNHVEASLREKNIYFPAQGTLDRMIGEIYRTIQRTKKEGKNQSISEILGKEVHSLGFIQKFIAKAEYRHFPPVYIGKLGIKKMGMEHKISLEIANLCQQEGIELSKLLNLPDIHTSKKLIERKAPSQLARVSREQYAEHLLKYYAARFQDAIDAIIQCFIKCARLMRFRIDKSYEEKANIGARTFFEKNSAEFHKIWSLIESGKKEELLRYKNFFDQGTATGNYSQNKMGHYKLLSSRYKYSRKLSRRIARLNFKGLDPSAHKVLECSKEVFKFLKFAEEVDSNVTKKLRFLQVPTRVIADRRIFEPFVLVTIAEFIASGRIAVKYSSRYQNVWQDIPTDIQIEGDPSEYIKTLKNELREQWRRFIDHVKTHPNLCRNGQINYRRAVSSEKREEREKKKGADKALESFGFIEIPKLLRVVHRHTGFLDAYQLVNPLYHGNALSDEDRENLALLTTLARGMNIGLKGIERAIENDYTIDQLKNFDENYVSIENLEAANRAIIRQWDLEHLGEPWGDGCGCSSDGKVMFSFVNNLFFRYHYRKGRMGVTIYWFVRNDWIANYVQIIGNDEWESWYVIDGLLNSYCDNEVRQSCGDTQAQLLALWGLGRLLDLDIRARFRSLKTVKLYIPDDDFYIPCLTDLSPIDWCVIKECLPSTLRLVQAIGEGHVDSKSFLRSWNIYDGFGNNIGDGIRELGKVSRTLFIMNYLMDEELQLDIRRGCNRAEFWNHFQDAVFWGRKGVIASNNPERQFLSAQFLMLVMNAIVYYNRAELGLIIEERLKEGRLSPVFWQHINFIGRFRLE